MKKWITKHKLLFALLIIVVAILFVVPPIIIACVCWTSYEASDILAYWGTSLTALGTMLLAALALWQNHQINEQATKNQKFFVQLEENKSKPYIDIKYVGSRQNLSDLRYSISNHGYGKAISINIKNYEGVMYQGYTQINIDKEAQKTVSDKIDLEVREKSEVKINYKEENNSGKFYVCLEFSCFDVFYKKHSVIYMQKLCKSEKHSIVSNQKAFNYNIEDMKLLSCENVLQEELTIDK